MYANVSTSYGDTISIVRITIKILLILKERRSAKRSLRNKNDNHCGEAGTRNVFFSHAAFTRSKCRYFPSMSHILLPTQEFRSTLSD